MSKILKYTYIAILGIIIASFTGCESVLEVSSPSVLSGASFWKSEEDVIAATQGMYNYLRALDEQLFLIGESRSGTCGIDGASTGYDQYFNNTLTSANSGASMKPFYTLINTCNLILKYTPDIDFNSEADKNYYLAQAYAMRALAYYYMVRAWGQLIIRTEPVEGTDPSVLYQQRSSVEDVFTLIKSDIDKAIELFDDHPNSSAPASGMIYWNKPAVYALKGDVYLWTAKVLNGGQADLQTALSALQYVQQQSGRRLIDDYSSIFDVNNKFNQELLFSAYYSKDERPNNFYWHAWVIQAGVPANIDEATKNIIQPTGGGQSLTPPSRLLIDSFDDDDTRKSGTVCEIYSIDENGDSTYITSVCLKGRGLVENGYRYFCGHVIIYRYADVLLMIAEAKNALGQDPSDEINQVRKRAYGDNYENHIFVSGSQEYNDEMILQERLLELSFECKRWFDLIRFGKLFELVPSLQGKDSYLSLFPINDSELSNEPYIEQNPGY